MRYGFNIFLLLLIFANQTLGQKRQGYIDYDKVVVTFPQYLVEQKKLDSRTKELNDSLKVLYNEFQDKVKVIVDYPQTTEARIYMQKKEQELIDMQRKLLDFRDRVDTKIKQLQDERDFNMKRVLSKELQMFSVDNNVICVLDKKSILYCNDCLDLSDEFINYCKSKRK